MKSQFIRWAGLCAVVLGGSAFAQVQAPAGGSDWANPSANAVQRRDAATPEQALFVQKCSMCHREMGMGTVILARRQPADRAILERREDLTPEYIRIAVRSGLGNMPRIPRGEVSDEQLDAIIRHLVKVKR
jgi:cytochrome c5